MLLFFLNHIGEEVLVLTCEVRDTFVKASTAALAAIADTVSSTAHTAFCTNKLLN
jgi:hypothetical protein